MVKRLVNIGDKFGTWEIIGLEENDKKYNYNYMCKCECGHVRMIRKDKLVSLTYPKCDKCLSNGTIDRKWDLIKSRWDKIVNGKLIYSELELKKQYMWKCPEGHSYKTSIFMLEEKCPKCRAIGISEMKMELNKSWFDNIVDYLDNVCSRVWDDDFQIKIDEDTLVIRLEVNGCIVVMTPKIHKSYDEILHGTKSNFYQLLVKIRGYKQDAIDDSREHIFLELNLNDKDIEKINSILGLVNSMSL